MQEPLCAHCGEVLGMYEPIVVLDPDGPGRTTSRAASGELAEGTPAVHEGCLQAHVEKLGAGD